MNTNSSTSIVSSSWAFFALALGWSWLFWITAILLGAGMETTLGIILALLGLLGPLVAGITGVYSSYGKEGRHDYWLRIIDPKRITGNWYTIIVLFVPLIFAVAVGFDRLMGGSGGAWEDSATEIFATPWMIFPFVLSILLVGPLEEFGWRGYVLDRLQERWSALGASLILGIVWSVWHLPLFFIKDSYQYNLGAGSQAFWLFMIGIVPMNVLFTWVFNNTGRSTLAAMLLHFMVNFTGELVALTPRAELYSILLWTLAALFVTLVWGAKTLTHPGGWHFSRVKTA